MLCEEDTPHKGVTKAKVESKKKASPCEKRKGKKWGSNAGLILDLACAELPKKMSGISLIERNWSINPASKCAHA